MGSGWKSERSTARRHHSSACILADSSRAKSTVVATVALLLLLPDVNGADIKYGPFNIVFTKVENCKGPKSKDCASFEADLLPGGRMVAIAMNVTENIKPEVAKVVMSSVSQQTAAPLFRMQMDKPCDHIFLRPLLTRYVNLTRSCIVNKNVYILKLDVAKVAEEYFGGQFMYGDFCFKAVIGSKNCNFSCSRFHFSTSPKH